MPMGDGRCSLCGYWHAPGSEHIGRRPSYGICARCGNFHTEGPCPKPEEPMRFPSRAEREAIGQQRRTTVKLRLRLGSFWTMCMTPELAADVTLQPIRRFGFDAGRFEVRASAELHEMQQSEDRARAIIRQRLIERAVRLATDLAERRHYLAHRMRIEACYGREVGHRCRDCTIIESIVRARFRELANDEGAARSAAGR